MQEILTLPNFINEQEKRTLKTILIAHGKWDLWKDQWKALGFKSIASFKQAAEVPMLLLATNICHAQDVIFLVEQHLDGSAARNKMATGNLDAAPPVTVLSIPGVNFAYGATNASTLIDSGDAATMIKNMRTTALESAKRKNRKYVTMPAIGMGAFLGNIRASEIIKLYFATLIQLMQTTYRNDFDAIYFNPAGQAPIFRTMLNAAKNSGEFPLFMTQKDVKFLAINLSKNGFATAFLNPSDADVIWGVYDAGEYYKNGHYVGEEDIGATSTAPIGSKRITPEAYTNRITQVSP